MDPPTNTTCQEYHWDGRPPWLCWSPLLGEQESGGGGVLVLFCTHFFEMARKQGPLGELWLEWSLQPLQHVRSTTGMAAHHGCVGLHSLVSKKVVGVVFSCYFARTFSNLTIHSLRELLDGKELDKDEESGRGVLGVEVDMDRPSRCSATSLFTGLARLNHQLGLVVVSFA